MEYLDSLSSYRGPGPYFSGNGGFPKGALAWHTIDYDKHPESRYCLIISGWNDAADTFLPRASVLDNCSTGYYYPWTPAGA